MTNKDEQHVNKDNQPHNHRTEDDPKHSETRKDVKPKDTNEDSQGSDNKITSYSNGGYGV
ncbi:hypothetical protein [Paenibacillus hunanensis]|uniref:3-methyladenine DNA glycosylase n=1 Tax=Paenibacillus hunanensis TaxID=539262 RepID=A0ABU1IVV2_9BACL|nr:hypothetical protein [Paenibacillus hunanensis]MCL9659965.1 hypothetical protein [Paenibacillus hunanensis]MDR6242502.1 hypothetical protein [Paenibacillus hunanensis]WPP39616.1 hypothetical protein SK066_13370 [Paenibacillus hunanensis]GGJ08293.1 hypothetical protein GCM10008022_16860 [Paenibacillus hunanensis]